MRKLSTMLALGLAMVLTLGMTVSAAESTSTGNTTAESEALAEQVTGGSVAGGSVNFEVLDGDVVDAAKSVAQNMVKEDDDLEDAKVVAAVDIKVEGVAEGAAATVTVNVSVVKAGKDYVALHEYEPGKWEVLPVTVLADGVISVTSSNWSPLVIVEVEEADEDEDEPKNKETEAAAGAVASPKTGEAIPMAGVMAVICLAGAVVCAKKVRD